ncbi:carboxy-terminal kinesin 2-like [Ischnura elegans]|uniref:carboxy-terminal kinesin 2-like n=1 Tax=Ischnura elegans TaxID=197161 RepID=UPI001ED8777E|nr:carboxy-terminal kinesin 2-like [Ischnura elegans]
MDSGTERNTSRIPRVNVGVTPRPQTSLPVSSGQHTGTTMSRVRPDPPRSARPVLQNRTGAVKRPFSTKHENVTETKNSALAPPGAKKAKPAPWDMKGKLQLAEERLLKMKETLESSSLEMEQLKKDNKRLQERNQVLEKENKIFEASLVSEKHLHSQMTEKANNLQIVCNEHECTISSQKRDLEHYQGLCAELQEKVKILEEARSSMHKNLMELKIVSSDHECTISSLKKDLQHYREVCAELQEKVKALDETRRSMHNSLMELKGNIRVFCRVRPLLPAEKAKNDSTEHISIANERSIDVYKGDKKIKNSFSFDRVFAPSAGQQEIFEDLAELVQSVIDGYNVCVFAYGQTGSGKTYTMEGGQEQNLRGMIPRSVDLLFDRLEEIKKLGCSSSVEASFLEIYNEQIRDLLDISQASKPCELRNPTSPGGDMVVTNLKVTTVKSADEVNELLEVARTNRAVAATVHNDHSSRSHFIFKLRIQTTNGETGKGTDSILSLVDLAGSERLVDISESDRVTETKNINKSLSNIGNVILALSNKSQHVPYRNSKLTHMLQPSLGGNSKTLMLINISPREECVEETLNSLRFAVRVSECHIGQARRKLK